MKKKPVIGGKEYDTQGFYWAKIYRNRITALYPNEREARQGVLGANATWEKNNWPREWSVKRFKFYFKGTEIDGFQHYWEREEVKSPHK